MPVAVGGHYLDPMDKVNGRASGSCSWLGRYADNGWAIEISPMLTPQQWQKFMERVDETWEGPTKGWSWRKALKLLIELYPGWQFRVLECPCKERVHPHKKEKTK